MVRSFINRFAPVRYAKLTFILIFLDESAENVKEKKVEEKNNVT